MAILAHYAALGEVWQERYGPHYQAGTVPDDIKGAPKLSCMTLLQHALHCDDECTLAGGW